MSGRKLMAGVFDLGDAYEIRIVEPYGSVAVVDALRDVLSKVDGGLAEPLPADRDDRQPGTYPEACPVCSGAGRIPPR